jgi:hypothetical protein
VVTAAAECLELVVVVMFVATVVVMFVCWQSFVER